MSGDKFLFQLAKEFVMYDDILDDERSNELDIEEAKEGMKKIRRILMRDYYDFDKFIYYIKLYKAMTIKDYYKFLKTFE